MNPQASDIHPPRSTATAAPRIRRFKTGAGVWLLVTVLIVGHFVLGASAWSRKSDTCDEMIHLTAGFSYWQTGDFRLVPESPPLAQLWASLPLNFMGARLPSLDEPVWRHSDAWTFGTIFLFQSGNDARRLVSAGRAMIGLLSAALALVVFLTARRLFGDVGGLVALTLYAFSPTTLTHGFLATTDLAVALFFFLSVLGIWRVLHRVTPWSVLLSGLALAGLFTTKLSAFIILPVYAVLMLIRLIDPSPLELRFGGHRLIRARPARLAMLSAVVVVQALIIATIIWTVYGFRFDAMRHSEAGVDRLAVSDGSVDPSPDTSWGYILNRLPATQARLIHFARDHRLLPEAYLYGLTFALDIATLRDSFLNGRRSVTGFAMFFPYCLFAKSTLPELALWLLGLSVMFWTARRVSRVGALADRSQHPTSVSAALGVFALVYFVIAVRSGFNIGSRHILPIYPALFVFAGAAGWLIRALRAALPVTALLVISQIGVAARSWPDYLAYFNLAAGGPLKGYQRLVDSSLDWGQDLYELAAWLEANRHPPDASERHAALNAFGESPVYLSYLGSPSPEAYGIDSGRRLFAGLGGVDDDAFPLSPGVYCISATRLQQVGLMPYAGWTPQMERVYQAWMPEVRKLQGLPVEADPERSIPSLTLIQLCFARLCAVLQARAPDGRAGYSILIYRVNAEELDRALFGSLPPLMADTAMGLTLLGDRFAEARPPTAAIDCYRRAIELDPGIARAHYNLGFVRFLTGDVEGAMRQLRRAIEADSRYADAYYRLGELLALRGHSTEAVEQFEMFLRLRPFHAEARQWLEALRR